MKIDKKQLIHIIGIGGIGMSGIAEILDGLGYSIQGSDINLNSNILRLRKKRIKIFIGHKQENLKNVDLVVYSTAIKKNNKEFTNIEQLSYIFPDDSHKLHEFNIQSKDYKLIPDFAFNRYLWECELEFN